MSSWMCQELSGIRQIRAEFKQIFWSNFRVQIDQLLVEKHWLMKYAFKKCEGFYTLESKSSGKLDMKHHLRGFCPQFHTVYWWRCKVNDTQTRGHMSVAAEMTCEMCWTWCRCQRWGGSTAAADSLRWLEKHFGGCYALLFYPSAVSACSLSLHTIKPTSLGQAPWAWHRKWSSVRDPLLTLPLPHWPSPTTAPTILVNETVLCSTSKGGTCVYPGFFFSLCLHLLHMQPSSSSLQRGRNELWLLIRPFDNISGRSFYGCKWKQSPSVINPDGLFCLCAF